MADTESSSLTGRATWSWSIGQDQRIVTVYEEPTRGGRLYLRWRESTGLRRNWRVRGLGVKLRNAAGAILQAVAAYGQRKAREQYRALGPATPEAPLDPSVAPLTIAQAAALIVDRDRGLYPRPTPHRAEALRALAFAEAVWGKDRPWAAIRRADLRALGRRRLEALRAAGHAGLRGAEVTVGRVLTIANWLRDEEHIPAHACIAPRHWKQELAKEAGEPDPSRPRYTVEEMRAILEAATRQDPRFALLVALGAELRLGQVVRLRRADLDLEAGTMTVRGAGKKHGTMLELTPGQVTAVRAALATGYLRVLDQRAPDYRMFPGGKLARAADGLLEAREDRSPMSRRLIGKAWALAEAAAGIAHQPGRAAYGVRRVAVDGLMALGISPRALQNAGGWQNADMPQRVYAAKDQAFARKEAAEKRALLRGEKPPLTKEAESA